MEYDGGLSTQPIPGCTNNAPFDLLVMQPALVSSDEMKHCWAKIEVGSFTKTEPRNPSHLPEEGRGYVHRQALSYIDHAHLQQIQNTRL